MLNQSAQSLTFHIYKKLSYFNKHSRINSVCSKIPLARVSCCTKESFSVIRYC